MPSIHVLSDDVRGKIAAGEVILRPSSVIKELIENSLDADSARVEIEIAEGGKERCLVNDDGCGMDRQDAQLALERYATSKIRVVEDIDKIVTYGFRGEALASIAQVARFEMETSDGKRGTRIVVEGGSVKGVFDSERPRGTKVKVSDVFYNLPARRKFLKSVTWERRLIVELVKHYSLIHPGIAFILADADKPVLNLAAVDSVLARAKMMFDKQIADALFTLECGVGNIRINGIVSHPDLQINHRLNYLYVNSRPVKYPRLYHTIMEAYGNPKNGPAYALNFVVEPDFVDANVHPAKTEVKFRDERYVTDILKQLIKKEVFTVSRTIPGFSGESPQVRTGSPKGFVQDMVIPYATEPVEAA